MVNVLFVCLGNICRSPTAEGVFRELVRREGLDAVIKTDSAGTSDWHIGEPPDPRAQDAAKHRGVDLSDLRCRQTRAQDFDDFDYVLAMDRRNHAALSVLMPKGRGDRLHMFLSFAPQLGLTEVPDPYYGAGDGFNQVLDMIEAASRGLLDHIRTTDLAR
ncbi:MAG TPA: phosphotyrosine protein phosphatase [Rhodospirillaceae bacterium]|nr:phosphotyrosine protein phosphatase [Rhodospirillaceae bacterium]